MRFENPDATPVPWQEGSVYVYGGEYDPDDCSRCEVCGCILDDCCAAEGETLCEDCAEENPYCLYCDTRIFSDVVLDTSYGDDIYFHRLCHSAAIAEDAK